MLNKDNDQVRREKTLVLSMIHDEAAQDLKITASILSVSSKSMYVLIDSDIIHSFKSVRRLARFGMICKKEQ